MCVEVRKKPRDGERSRRFKSDGNETVRSFGKKNWGVPVTNFVIIIN